MSGKLLTDTENEHIIALLRNSNGLMARSLVVDPVMNNVSARQLGHLIRHALIRAVKTGLLPHIVWEDTSQGRVYYVKNSIVPKPFDEMIAECVSKVFWQGMTDNEFNDLIGNLVWFTDGCMVDNVTGPVRGTLHGTMDSVDATLPGGGEFFNRSTPFGEDG